MMHDFAHPRLLAQAPLLESAPTFLDRLNNIWHAPLYSVSGNDIELNQVVIAATVILLGTLAARIITRLVAARVARINRINRHVAQIIQRLVFYALVAVVTLVALPIAGIPITIFAVLGGAVAIGVGFGAQNLCNNLISGMILMVEHPVRLGDIVEIDGHEGKVEAINNRCTRVVRGDGVDLLVPNSAFLQTTIVNWTLSDNHIRGKVGVGVAYGSPARRVEALLHQVAREHPRVLTEPPPIVLFEDFGDNALLFNLHFWTGVQTPMDLRLVQSDLRFAIDQQMNDAGITLAFPQRDVHLDSVRPIQIQWADGAATHG